MKKRFTVIKDFLGYISQEDVCIFSGAELCKEAFKYDREGNFYINQEGIALSFSIGMSMNTDKTIYVFMSDVDLFSEYGSIAHMVVSKRKNLIIVVLNDGCYQSTGNQPSITGSLTAIKSSIFNLGALVHDLTKHFNDSRNKTINILLNSLSGPAVLFIDVDKGLNKKLKEINFDENYMTNRIINFLSVRNE